MTYIYTESNQFSSPCKYTYTKYYGFAFLDDYKKSRSEFLKNYFDYDFRPVESKEDILKMLLSSLILYQKNHSFVDLISPCNSVNTDQALLKIVNSLVCHKKSSIAEQNILNSLLKRFEISKKLHSSYNVDYKLPNGSFLEPQRYFIFSTILQIYFLNSLNYQYLSTALKVNDLIISAQDKLLCEDQCNTKILCTCIICELSLVHFLRTTHGI